MEYFTPVFERVSKEKDKPGAVHPQRNDVPVQKLESKLFHLFHSIFRFYQKIFLYIDYLQMTIAKPVAKQRNQLKNENNIPIYIRSKPINAGFLLIE